jgi:hypothetical protein
MKKYRCLVVVVIVGLFAGILVPLVQDQLWRATQRRVATAMRNDFAPPTFAKELGQKTSSPSGTIGLSEAHKTITLDLTPRLSEYYLAPRQDTVQMGTLRSTVFADVYRHYEAVLMDRGLDIWPVVVSQYSTILGDTTRVYLGKNGTVLTRMETEWDGSVAKATLHFWVTLPTSR